MLVFLSIRLPIDYTGKPVPGPWPLAIRFEQLIRDGVARDQADLARLALVSRARVTQIMDLLMLAPDNQEALLFLPPVHQGRDPITERDVRRARTARGVRPWGQRPWGQSLKW